jgi:REP element-mobilizing transposase RayT
MRCGEHAKSTPRRPSSPRISGRCCRDHGSSPFRSDLFAYLGGIVRELRGTALIINGTCDHVHMLMRIRPVQSVAEIARIVKTNSSGWIRKKGHKEFAWQAGYGVFSVSESSVPAGMKYIATQDEHHKKRSFQEEFLEFLKKNKVAYDERYIWD